MLRNTYRKWFNAIGRGALQSRPKALRRRPWRGLQIEEMESRYAPAVSISITGGVLTATSDSAGNTITVDHNASTSLTTVNGLNFADAAFNSIRINGGSGHDTDNLLATPAKPATINDVASATVNVGKAGSVQGILGLLSIENPPNFNTLTVDDSVDPGVRTVTLDTFTPAGDSLFGRIIGLSPQPIEYESADTSSLTIKTGHAVDTVNVSSLALANTADVTTLVGNANETVNVGSSGSVQGITTPLTVTNAAGLIALTVNNSADTGRRLVTMGVSAGVGFISGLSPATINYNQTQVSAVTVAGGPNSGGGGGFNVYTVTNTATNGTNPLTTLNVGNATNATVNLQATSGALTVTSTGSNETWTVGSAGSVQGIHGTLSFNNAQNTAVVLTDSADTGFRSVTINDTSVVGLTPAVINYQGHTGLFVHTGISTNGITINGNSGSAGVGTSLFLGSHLTPQIAVRATTAPLNILPDSGSSDQAEVIVGSLAPFIGTGDTVQNIHGAIFDGESAVLGGALFVEDQSDPTGRTVTVGGPSGNAITGLAPAAITFISSRQSPVDITGGTGVNIFTVTGTPPGVVVLDPGSGGSTVNVQHTGGEIIVDGQGGVDTVNLGQASDGTASIQGTVFVDNVNGHSVVNVNDTANPFAGTNVTLSVSGTSGTVSGLGVPFSPFTLQYVSAEVSSLTINGGNHGNVYNVQNVPSGVATTVNAGNGNNTINVGNAANTLDGIQGPLTVNGGTAFDTLNINDQGETTPHSYTVTSSSVIRSPGGPTINYAGIESLNLHPGVLLASGPTNNVVDVQSTDANTSVEVDAAGGAVVNVGNEAGTLDDLQGPLNVNGDGTVSLNVNDQGSGDAQGYSLAATTVDRTGAAETTYAGVADVTLNAGAGGNQIDVQSIAAGTPAVVNAGAGGDLIRMRGGPIDAPLTLVGQGNTHLGYVAYSTPVFVDVQTGQATDVAGGFTGISDITGGSDVNILVGDGTVNLTGAPGSQNLLISGGGSGLTLTGGGGAGDILIDGTTAYDADANGELEAIMAEWTRTDIPYGDIVSNILTGSDTAVDPYPLNESTVFDNGGQNNLVGHPQGGEMNLYFVTNSDANDATPDETVINISGSTAGGGGMVHQLGGQAVMANPVAGAAPALQSHLTQVLALDAAHATASTRSVQASQPPAGLAQPWDHDLAWLGGVNGLALEGLGVG